MSSILMATELARKLRYKAGKALILNAPAGYDLNIEIDEEIREKYDFAQLFVNNAGAVREWLPNVIESLTSDAVFWITYPKQSSGVKTDINRDTLAAIVQNETTYQVVTNVSIDETWSALRLRQKDKVKASK